ncbi:hypothetical protein DUGA6_62100 [Duganella sp. HH105]|nr:hypothetical protein DUGA6_62100 [Duganella sp. HH105]OEZ95964.1 hypothetical protein DUGA2_64150 [Duganella sp. HH101]
MAGAGRGAHAVRPVHRPADPRAPAAHERFGAHRAVDHAPHRLGRLVHRRSGAGSGRALRRIRPAAAIAAAGAADPVRRLRALAAPVAQWPGAATAARLLARLPDGRAGFVDAADGPSAPGASDPSRRDAAAHTVGHHHGGPQCAKPPEAKHLVHDADGGLQCAAVALRRAGRHLHRHANRQPQPRGNRRSDRLLRQYAGAAHASRSWRQFPAIARPSTRQHAGRVRAPGRAVRTTGRSAQAGAPYQPFAAVPGDAGVAERADGRAHAARPDLAGHER